MKRKKGNPKLWSVTHIRDPRYPHIQVRITELRGTPFLYLGRQLEGKPRYAVLEPKVTRASLGSTAKEQEQRARALALNEIAKIAKEETAPTAHRSGGPLTLAQLADRYERDGFAGRTEAYKRDALASLRRIAAFVDAETPVSGLKPIDVQNYVAHRHAQGVTAAPRGDVVALKIACNWAVETAELLELTPFARPGFKRVLPKKGQPRRPVAKKDRYEKLKAVAGHFPPAFGVLLELAWHTGHRIGALRTLHWRDVSLEQEGTKHGAIRWYSDVRGDNKKHEHVVAMNAEAQAAVRRWQKQCRGIGQQWVFPALTDATKPLDYHVAKKWLKQAETRAKVGHEKQGGWHMLRRGWATARKHLAIQDVAVAGGWLDTATPAQIYQQADAETTQAVATYVA